MTRLLVLVAGLQAILSALLLVRSAAACAGCRNPSFSTPQSGAGSLEGKAFRVGATLTATSLRVVHEAGCATLEGCMEVPVQPAHLHDQRISPFELRLFGEYALTPLLGAELQVPLRLVHTSIRYTTKDGAPYQPLDAGVHHRNETLAGFSDPWVLLRIGTTVQGFWLALRPGISLPAGRTEPNPFTLGDEGLRHQHIQLGSGTFDPVLLLEVTSPEAAIFFDAFAQLQAALYDNRHGYRAPQRVAGGAYAMTRLGHLTVGMGPELSHDGPERWDGSIRQDGLLGRTEALLGARLSQALEPLELQLSLRVPVWRKLIEGDEPTGNLEALPILSFGAAYTGGP